MFWMWNGYDTRYVHIKAVFMQLYICKVKWGVVTAGNITWNIHANLKLLQIIRLNIVYKNVQEKY